MNQDYLPSRSSFSASSSNVARNIRTLAARNINQEMSFSSIDVSDIASLYSDDLPNEKASSQKAEEDALAAAAVPEPTTALGTLLALGILPVIKRFKNQKNQK
ncbi:MAG: PEP-CTERM sorting domain-containing protein [Microcoleus sp.]